MKFKLFHYWRSSCSWRVRWALALKEIPCEFVSVNILSDEAESVEYLKRNPMGYVPALEITESKTPRVLCESIAILEYLEEIYPRPALLPKDPFERARVRQLVETINSGTQPIQNPTVTQTHSSDPEEQKNWNRTWIRKGLGAYETLVKDVAGQFSYGDTISFADLVLIPQCYNALRFQVDLKEFPIVETIYHNALKTEHCQKAAPERFQPAT